MKVKVQFVAKSLSVVIVHVSLSQTMDSYGNNQYGYIRMPVRALAERLPVGVGGSVCGCVAGCISQDTYLLYLYLKNTEFVCSPT